MTRIEAWVTFVVARLALDPGAPDAAVSVADDLLVEFDARFGVAQELERRPLLIVSPSPSLALTAITRDHIVAVMNQSGGSKADAARVLGISRRSLYRRLELHGLHLGHHVTKGIAP